MRVELVAEAERDLRQIATWIARDDPSAALQLVNKLEAACSSLADFPKRFPVLPGYEKVGIRHRSLGNYLIFYVIEEHRVAVIQVLHGAMEYQHLLDFYDQGSRS